MSRSIWKGFFLSNSLLRKKKKNKILIWGKNNTITGDLKGNIFFVYNGKIFKKIYITSAKIGFKFGEFVFTRTFSKKKKDKVK